MPEDHRHRADKPPFHHRPISSDSINSWPGVGVGEMAGDPWEIASAAHRVIWSFLPVASAAPATPTSIALSSGGAHRVSARAEQGSGEGGGGGPGRRAGQLKRSEERIVAPAVYRYGGLTGDVTAEMQEGYERVEDGVAGVPHKTLSRIPRVTVSPCLPCFHL